jgi:hypothetical protein
MHSINDHPKWQMDFSKPSKRKTQNIIWESFHGEENSNNISTIMTNVVPASPANPHGGLSTYITLDIQELTELKKQSSQHLWWLIWSISLLSVSTCAKLSTWTNAVTRNTDTSRKGSRSNALGQDVHRPHRSLHHKQKRQTKSPLFANVSPWLILPQAGSKYMSIKTNDQWP